MTSDYYNAEFARLGTSDIVGGTFNAGTSTFKLPTFDITFG
jgi:hypothetical protein